MLYYRGRSGLIGRFDPASARKIASFYTNAAPSAGSVRPTGWNNCLTGIAVYCEFTDLSISAGGNRCYWTISDGTANNRAFQQKATVSGNNRLNFALTESATIRVLNRHFAAGLLSGRHKVLYIMRNGLAQCWLDGYLIWSSTAFNMPVLSAAAGGLYIGGLQDGTQLMSGDANVTLHEFRLYDSNNLPSEAQAAAITRNTAIITGVTQTNLPIYVGLGQSNMVGQATGTPIYNGTAAGNMKLLPYSGVYGAYADPWAVSTSSLITSLNDATAANSYMGYALERMAIVRGSEIILAPACLSATSVIATATNALGYNASTVISAITNTGGSSVNSMGTVLMSSLQRVILAGQHGIISGIVYQQGESEAGAGSDQAAYRLALQNTFNQIKNVTNAPLFIASLSAWNASTGATQVNWNATNATLQTVANDVGATFINLSGVAGTDVHYTTLTQVGNVGLIVGNALLGA